MKDIILWIISPKYVWLCLAVVAVAACICLRCGAYEPVVRLTGLALQLLGILTVLWGISKTRAQFGQPSIADGVHHFFSAMPHWRQKKATGSGSSTLGRMTVQARGYGTHNPVDQSIDSRFEALEKNIGVAQTRITALQNEVDGEFRKINDQAREEQRVRSQEDQATRATLEAAATGGVHISAIGAVWLFVGVILSTAGIEISRMLT